MRKVILAAALACTLAFVALPASPASAAFTCHSGNFCIYNSQNGVGNIYEWGPEFRGSRCHNLGIAPNGINYGNEAESAANLAPAGNLMILYDLPNCATGGLGRIVIGGGTSTFNLVPRNVASSIDFYV